MFDNIIDIVNKYIEEMKKKQRKIDLVNRDRAEELKRDKRFKIYCPKQEWAPCLVVGKPDNINNLSGTQGIDKSTSEDDIETIVDAYMKFVDAVERHGHLDIKLFTIVGPHYVIKHSDDVLEYFDPSYSVFVVKSRGRRVLFIYRW